MGAEYTAHVGVEYTAHVGVEYSTVLCTSYMHRALHQWSSLNLVTIALGRSVLVGSDPSSALSSF